MPLSTSLSYILTWIPPADTVRARVCGIICKELTGDDWTDEGAAAQSCVRIVGLQSAWLCVGNGRRHCVARSQATAVQGQTANRQGDHVSAAEAVCLLLLAHRPRLCVQLQTQPVRVRASERERREPDRVAAVRRCACTVLLDREFACLQHSQASSSPSARFSGPISTTSGCSRSASRTVRAIAQTPRPQP